MELLAAITMFFSRVGLTAQDVGIKVSSRKVLQQVSRGGSAVEIVLAVTTYSLREAGCEKGCLGGHGSNTWVLCVRDRREDAACEKSPALAFRKWGCLDAVPAATLNKHQA